MGDGSNVKGWGSASSPVLAGDVLIINASEECHAIIGLDRKTGRSLWRAEGVPLSNVFGTPVVTTHEGRTDLLIAVPEELWSINPETGKLR
ncbi:MAG: hypothetical protein EXS25_06460 [Pedosphaera sp.]|nr:hypothetical protein [Pedosphaera sp.]